MQESSHINFLLDKDKRTKLIEAKTEIEKNREVIKILLDITRFLAVQGLAFRGHQEDDSNFRMIVDLVARHNSVLASWISSKQSRKHGVTYLSKDSQEEFISLLGGEVQAQIVSEINDSQQVRIIADTTPDVAHIDQLSLAARYVDSKGCIKERLLSISPVHDKTGKGMAEAILHVCTNIGLNPDIIRFQTYDSAASMSGKYNGAQENLSKILGRKIKYIACLPHGANLVIEHGCKASKMVRDMFDTLENLYVFFTGSTNRHDKLTKLLNNPVNQEQHKKTRSLTQKNLSKARWSARPDAIEAVVAGFKPIITALTYYVSDDSVDKDTAAKSKGLLSRMKSFDFIYCLNSMKTIMAKTKYMTDLLQKVDISFALRLMKMTKSTLSQLRTDKDTCSSHHNSLSFVRRTWH